MSLDAVNLASITPALFLILVLGLSGFVFVMLARSPLASRNAAAEGDAAAPAASYRDLINRGNEHLNRFAWDEALKDFLAARQIKATDPALHFKIGRIYSQKDDHERAVDAFKQALAFNPGGIQTLYELARLHLKRGQALEAEQFLDQALAIDPAHEDTLRLKLKCLEQQQRYDDALLLLADLLKPGAANQIHRKKYRMQYAELLVKNNRLEAAIGEYEAMIGEDPANKAVYEMHIAQLYYALGEFEQAIDHYRRIILSNDPLSRDPQLRLKLAAALCNQGVYYFKDCQDYPMAIQYYKEAIGYDDGNPDIFYNLGKVHLELKQVEQAKTYFSQAVALSPTDVLCAYELAAIEDHQGHVDAAIKAYQHVLSLDPRHVMAAFGLGTLFGVRGDFDRAIDCLSQVIRLKPDFEDAVYNLGVALEKQKQPVKAMAMYKRVLGLNPAHEEARSNLQHLELQTRRK